MYIFWNVVQHADELMKTTSVSKKRCDEIFHDSLEGFELKWKTV